MCDKIEPKSREFNNLQDNANTNVRKQGFLPEMPSVKEAYEAILEGKSESLARRLLGPVNRMKW